MVCSPRDIRTLEKGSRFARRQRHRDLRSDARHHETHQREAENLSRASAPDIVFARLSRTMAEQFVKDPAPSSKWLKYYTDKTKPLENATGLNPPIVIPDNEMLNFIKATSVPSAHSGMISKDRIRYKSGDLVQITQGDFKGIIGKVVRAAGQQRVAIELEGIGIFITAYIPNDFLKVLERCETVVW